MFRARGIGNYGDYYTPEGFVPGSKENTTMPWMVIYQLAGTWVYQPDTTSTKALWVVRKTWWTPWPKAATSWSASGRT